MLYHKDLYICEFSVLQHFTVQHIILVTYINTNTPTLKGGAAIIRQNIHTNFSPWNFTKIL